MSDFERIHKLIHQRFRGEITDEEFIQEVVRIVATSPDRETCVGK